MEVNGINLGILAPALLAGILVLSTHIPLGQQVLARGIIFLDLAVAQIAGLGIVAAHSFDFDAEGWQIQLIAFSSALTGALLLYIAERLWPNVLEAIIGSVFILAASGVILLLASNPHGGEHLNEILTGQILWVSYEQLIPVALLYSVVLSIWFGFKRQCHPLVFYILFALSITASVQLIGVYLVFASLIIPALAVHMAKKYKLIIAYIMGTLAYIVGLSLSAIFDLPSGAVITWTLAIIGALLAITLSIAQSLSDDLAPAASINPVKK